MRILHTIQSACPAGGGPIEALRQLATLEHSAFQSRQNRTPGPNENFARVGIIRHSAVQGPLQKKLNNVFACRSVHLRSLLEQSAQQIVPVAVTAAESIEKLRNWASGRCLAANSVGIYQKAASSAPRRRIKGDASSN